MDPEVYKVHDEPYLLWMQENPAGYVANTHRNESSTLFKIHRSGCPHISTGEKLHRPNAFTAYSRVKICSTDLDSLKDWATKERPNAKIESCTTCDAPVT